MKELSNKDLIEILDTRILLEKENEAELIDYIREVDYRRLYIEFGATSMFDFLTHARYDYCASVAQKKIQAARLMQLFPYIKELLANGELNITQLGIAESVFKKHDPCMKVREEILEEMRGQTVDASRQILNEKLNIEIKRYQKIRPQRDGSVLADLTFEAEQWAIVQQAKQVFSHSVPSGDLVALIVFLFKKALKKTSPREGPARQSQGVSAADRRTVLDRDKSCRHKHPDGSFCESTYQLQVDHIISIWLGGSNELANLQAMCGVHNRYKYELETS